MRPVDTSGLVRINRKDKMKAVVQGVQQIGMSLAAPPAF